ncbi:MAG TPA: substrate-binding domain-containing protein [Conexibacter sp.]|jgi:tungstate transport system substrate-binding protein|nr:substrate-binding domain-containing protein [Conexibacter sp.]
MEGRFVRAVTLSALLCVITASSASADPIRVQSTTDTVDAGLVDGLLKPLYAQAHPGDTLQYTAVGTGRALDNAKNGLGDVVITHAPTLEQQFVTDGWSLESAGRAIFYSDYVIVGPTGDPAGVRLTAPHDAISALEAIATAGSGGTATFVSRGDNSGTNVQEQLMWGLTSTVAKQAARNANGAAGRFEPSDGVGGYPAWYVQSGKGQAGNLGDADVCATANGGCYTMVDRGTYNRLLDSGTITHLAIVSQSNAAEARGGKDLLVNPFSVYVVNPARVGGVDVAAAQRFVDFLTSRQFQDAVDTYPTTTDPAFHADAFPSVALTSPFAATASAGAHVTLSLRLANRQPGAPVVNGMPVQLQQSTDGGRSWADAGGPQTTDASGAVTFTPTIASTTTYRVSLGRFQATSWNAFSPSTQDLGVVSVVAPPAPRSLVDHTKPTVRRLALTRTRLTLTISEPGTVKATIAKRTVRHVRRHGRLRFVVTFRTVRSATRRAAKAGVVTLQWQRKLPAGTYRVTLRATDLDGNVRVERVALRITADRSIRR